jgi:thiamine biosynthesis lipoprotein
MSRLISPPPNRRRFLALATGACGAAGWWRWQDRQKKVTRQSQALGASVSMTALHADESIAQSALEAAFAELEQIEAVMSLYRPESQICRLNRDSVLEMPDARFLEVLRFAALVAERCGGAFDATVQPLWALKGAAADATTLSKVDWRRVHISAERVEMERGMAITLNGIAQGYAADAAIRVIREHGVRHALVDAGEISASGHSRGGEGWRVGVQHPRRADAFAALARLGDRCLATSGDYQTAFSADFSKHHILDPRTGLSPSELASVSVAAPDGMTADALSTALFVLGPEHGLELLREFAGTDALLITKTGRRLATAGFPFC